MTEMGVNNIENEPLGTKPMYSIKSTVRVLQVSESCKVLYTDNDKTVAN